MDKNTRPHRGSPPILPHHHLQSETKWRLTALANLLVDCWQSMNASQNAAVINYAATRRNTCRCLIKKRCSSRSLSESETLTLSVCLVSSGKHLIKAAHSLRPVINDWAHCIMIGQWWRLYWICPFAFHFDCFLSSEVNAVGLTVNPKLDSSCLKIFDSWSILLISAISVTYTAGQITSDVRISKFGI